MPQCLSLAPGVKNTRQGLHCEWSQGIRRWQEHVVRWAGGILLLLDQVVQRCADLMSWGSKRRQAKLISTFLAGLAGAEGVPAVACLMCGATCLWLAGCKALQLVVFLPGTACGPAFRASGRAFGVDQKR